MANESIWYQFKQIAGYQSTLNSKNCWSCCHGCKKRWNVLNTEYVHLLKIEINKTVSTRFVGDCCIKTKTDQTEPGVYDVIKQ